MSDVRCSGLVLSSLNEPNILYYHLVYNEILRPGKVPKSEQI